MSSFSWLDFSDKDRQRALDIVDQFRERDTRDELGLGGVRDAIADHLFPGTGTVQTRARYFLIVPWLYQRLEKAKVPSAEVALKMRTAELKLIDVLLAAGDTNGVIGRRAGKNLKRVPSDVYWQGLGRLGIRLFPRSRDQYHRSVDDFYSRNAHGLKNDDGEYLVEGRRRNWDSALPAAPQNFPQSCTLDLTEGEAEYLMGRVQDRAPRSLMAYLLTLSEGAPDVDFVWEHPDATSFPAHVARPLLEARNFSTVMHGAALLYNLMLAEKTGDAERCEDYQSRLARWSTECEEHRAAIMTWNVGEFWNFARACGANAGIATVQFVSAWISLVRSGPSRRLAHESKARELIVDREVRLKGRLARLSGGAPLETWLGASGANQLDFRWKKIARQVIVDIQNGLRRNDARAA